MGKKLALNVLYNVGIFICLIALYQGITSPHFMYAAIAVIVGALLVFLKIRLLKEVRRMQNKP